MPLESGVNGQFTYELPNFGAALDNFLNNFENAWESISSGWDAFLTFLEDVVDGEVFGIELPLVGDELQEAAAFISDLREVTSALDLAGTDERDLAKLKTVLFQSLGPDNLNWLKDNDGDDDIDMNDIVITNSNDNLQIDLLLGQSFALVDTPVDFDLGLPGLGLDVDGNVQVELEFKFALSFGINKQKGFY